MKNKLTLTVLIATMLIIATVAMANGTLITEPIANPTEEFSPSFDRLASYMGYDTEENFTAFHKTAVFMGKYCSTEESFSFIEQMILSGCDPQTTMDIYQFYLTTNEPISIVKQIYDMVYTGEKITNRDIVFENAFNEITKNKCGVLTEDDVIAYLEKGLSVSDISQANLLSRKGIMTIQQILDALLSGTSWEEIIETISGETISASEATDIAAVNAVLSNRNTDEHYAQKTKEVNASLKEKGYWKGRRSENFAQIVTDAEKKGISKAKLTELSDKGYSEVDLINIINDPTCTAKTVDLIVKSEVTE